MANIDGFDLRERPWQPGMDDARFNQQPRNPNFTGGASPEATAYQRANDARMEAAKVGLATGAQRLASAWSMVSANAGVTDNTNLNISA